MGIHLFVSFIQLVRLTSGNAEHMISPILVPITGVSSYWFVSQSLLKNDLYDILSTISKMVSGQYLLENIHFGV